MPSSRSPLRTVLRWTGRIVLSLVALLALATGTVYALSARLLSEHFDVPRHELAVRADSASIARGAHLATIRGCTDCHGANLRGHVIADDPGVGRIAGPNLTAGGRGRDLTDADWERAVRHGVRRDGSPLIVMPSGEFNRFTDEDLAALVAYARSLPADTHAAPPTRAGPVIRALHVTGKVEVLPAREIDHAAPHAASIVVEPTAAYGRYVATTCQGCHNPSLTGGKIPGAPPDWKPSANITPEGIGHYTEADFITALRTARRPDGSAIDPQMPVAKMTSQMTDTELRALYAYLRTVPARPYAQR
ncbi:MAG: c-type cytochrome [Gemmatirosa sp.]